MRKFGLSLIILGALSLILPLIGVQLRIMQLFGGKPILGFIFIGAGAILFVAGWLLETMQKGKAPAQAWRPSPAVPPGPASMHAAAAHPPPPVPGQPSPPRPPPVNPDRFGQACPRCGAIEVQGARFCGTCGHAFQAAAPPPPQQPPYQPPAVQSSGGGAVLAVIAVVVILLVGGAIAGVAYFWLGRSTTNTVSSTPAVPVGGTSTNNPRVANPPIGIEVPKPPVNIRSKTVGKARLLIDQRQYQDAIRELDAGLAAEPNSPAMLSERARAKLWIADYNGSQADYVAAVSRDPNELTARCELLTLRLNLDQPSAVLAEAKQLANQHPSDPRVIELMAKALLWNNDAASTPLWFERLKELDPTSPQRIYDRGRDLLDAGVFTQANVELASAVWLAPDNGEAYYHLGVARDSIGQPDNAAEAFNRYLEIEPQGEHAKEVQQWLSMRRR